MGILNGIRVLELGLYLATPLCTRILASVGAEVIRLETSKSPDMARYMGAQPGSTWNDYGALKKMATLDLRHPGSREILHKLVAISDVVVTNLGKDFIAAVGLDYPHLTELKPDVIMLWQTGFGKEGPYAGYKAYGGLMQAATGLSSVIGFPGGRPGSTSAAFCDYPSALFGVILIAAALDRRRRTGKGSFIEVPLYETGTNILSKPVMDYLVNGRIATQQGNRHPYASPHGIYPCQGEDRWCAIAVFTDEEWRRLCDVLGNPPWTKSPKFASVNERIKNAGELDQNLGEWTMTRSAHDVAQELQAAGIASGIVMKGEDLDACSHLKQRGFYKESEFYNPPFDRNAQVAGTTVAMDVPIRFSETPVRFGPTGRIGEDNEYVYGTLLGMSKEEIEALTREGILT